MGATAMYLVSDSRSGSTLLQHLLGLQPGIVPLGEVRRLGVLAQRGYPCACGAPVGTCPFWMSIAASVGAEIQNLKVVPSHSQLRRRLGHVAAIAAVAVAGGRPVARRFLKAEQAVAQTCCRIYDAALAASGTRLVVDASKVPSQFLHLNLYCPGRVIPVFLVRDGRAVVWSKMRRAGRSAEVATRQWVQVNRSLLLLRRLVGDEGRSVKYEDLCSSPAVVVADVLRGTGLSVETLNLAALPHDRHDLGGSPTFRQGTVTRIERDDRWMIEMPAEAQRVFERLGGDLNRRLGYV